MQTIYHNISNLHHLAHFCFEFVARRNHQGRRKAALLQPSPGHLEFGCSWTSTGETNVSDTSPETSGRQIIVLILDLLHIWDYTAMNHVQCSYTRAKQHGNGILSFCEGNTSANGPSNGPSSTAIRSGCYASSEDPAVTQSNHFYVPILYKSQRVLKFCRVFPHHNNITTTIISYPWASGTDCFKFCHAVAIRTTQWILRQWRYSRYSWYKYSWYSFMVSWDPTSIISAYNEKNQTLFKLQ